MQTYTFSERLVDFIEVYKRAKKWSKRTFEDRRRTLYRISDTVERLSREGKLGCSDPKLFEPEYYQTYFIDRGFQGVSVDTIRRELSLIGRVCKFYGNLSYDVAVVRFPDVFEAPIRTKLPAYDRGFIDRLVKAAEQTDDYDTMRALASAMLSVGGGLRLIELQNAKVSNLDRRNATLKLDVVKGMDRYGKPRVVPLAPEIMPQMDRFLAMREEFLRDKPYKTDLFFFNSWDGTVLSDRFSYRYRKVVEEVIGEHFDFRGCRRTFSQNAADVGVSDESISVVMGHSTTRTTNLHYSRRPTSVALEEFDSVRNDKTRGNDHGTETEGSGGNP